MLGGGSGVVVAKCWFFPGGYGHVVMAAALDAQLPGVLGCQATWPPSSGESLPCSPAGAAARQISGKVDHVDRKVRLYFISNVF